MAHRNNIVPAATSEVRSNRQKYHSGVPNQILDMAHRGMFPEEWCAELGIAMRTLYAWANEHPEFEEAVEAAWHALHAYWIKLLRENVTNPAFRQTAALQVMAKRFPATWGQQSRNTLEHFEARNAPDAEDKHGNECPRCRSVQSLSDEELEAEIEMILKRLEALQ
jgi:hypothetical protein